MTTRNRKSGRCTISAHGDRERIEAAGLSGISLTALITKYPTLTRASISRHCSNQVDDDHRLAYLVDLPIKELAQRAVESGASLLDYTHIARSQVFQALLNAGTLRDSKTVANLGKTAVSVLEFEAELTGQLVPALIAKNHVNNNTAVFINTPMFAPAPSDAHNPLGQPSRSTSVGGPENKRLYIVESASSSILQVTVPVAGQKMFSHS